MSLRISEISILDTYGTKSVKFSPGTVTRIRGANSSGKSSILRAIGAVFDGGCDASIIRKGSQKSVIEIKLNNGVVITKTTAPVKQRKAKAEDPDPPVKYTARTEVLDADETPVPAPQTYINELSAALAVDPSVLLRIDTTTAPGRKQLADTLMKLVPISFDPEDVNRAVAYRSSMETKEADTIALPQSPDKPLNLDDLKKAVTQITEQRRRVGQTRDDSDGAVNRLQKALPDDGQDGSMIGPALLEAEEYRRGIETSISDRKIEIEKEKAGALLEASALASQQSSKIDEDIDARVKILEAERVERKSKVRANHDLAKSNIDSATRLEYETLDSESRPLIEKAAADIQVLKDRQAAFQRAATLREEIATQLATCQAAHWKYDRLTDVLQRLEALRLEKLNGLPVRGLIVEDGSAFLDGVEWPNVNLARRVEAVLEICTQQTGKLPFVILDDSEHLDDATREAIENGLAQSGYQLLEAQVTEGPLTIEPMEMPVNA